jgi:hypothetical protein
MLLDSFSFSLVDTATGYKFWPGTFPRGDNSEVTKCGKF